MATSIGVKLGIDGESEYRKALKNIVEQTKTLDKQMKTLESSFDDETDAMEANAKQTELLQAKAEKLTEEIEMMKDMVEKAAEMYGESSTECQKWQQALADAETELNNTNSAIQDHEDAMEDAQSALGQLTSEISDQKSELEDLRDAYINAVLEFGEGSDEAEELAGQIADLNEELSNNQSELDSAVGSYDSLIASLSSASAEADSAASSVDGVSSAVDGIAEGATNVLGTFSPAMADIITAASSADLLGAIGGVAEAVGGIVTEILNVKEKWDEVQAILAVGTGKTGTDLETLEERAKALWLAISDKDFTLDNASNTLAALDTRLGEDYTSSEELTTALGMFASTANVDGATAVNGLVDALKSWGLITGDTDTDIQTLISTMDMLMNAQSLADVSVTELMTSLQSQAAAYQGLGMDMEGAIGFMTAYRDASGEVSEVTTSMKTAYDKLKEKTDDVPGAFQLIIDALTNASSVTEALETPIGNLGITIDDVFGGTKAQAIAKAFVNGKADTEGFTSAIKNSNGTLVQMYNESRTTGDQIDNFKKTVKTAAEDVIYSSEKMSQTEVATGNNMQDAIGAAGMAIVGWLGIGGKTDTATNDASNSFDTMSDNIDGSLSVVNDSASRNLSQLAGNFNTSMNGITSDVSWAQSAWASIIGSTIYGPTITAPTITYTKTSNGSMIPSATYHTYARAYGQALELNNPTIFGAMGGSFLKGGEKAGAEVVVGESHLLDMFESSVRNALGYVGNGGLAQIENLLRQYLPQVGNTAIYLDTDELVGGTVEKMNSALARLDTRASRGGY